MLLLHNMRLFFNYKPFAIRYLLLAICLLAFVPAFGAQAVGPDPAGPPVIDSISPGVRNTGYALFTLTIDGYNFLPGNLEVSIGETVCRSGTFCEITSETATRITVLVQPGLLSSEYNVRVTNFFVPGFEVYEGSFDYSFLNIISQGTLTIIKYTSGGSPVAEFPFTIIADTLIDLTPTIVADIFIPASGGYMGTKSYSLSSGGYPAPEQTSLVYQALSESL